MRKTKFTLNHNQVQSATLNLLVDVVATQEILFEAVAMALSKLAPSEQSKVCQEILFSKEAALPEKRAEVWKRILQNCT